MDRVNSWLPLGALVLTVVAVMALVNQDPQHGRQGPPIAPGLIQPPGFERLLPAADSVVVETSFATLPASAAPLAVGAPFAPTDYETVPWDQVVIVLEDEAAFTRSFARGLAEHLVGVVASVEEATPIPLQQAAGVVHLQPLNETATSAFAVRRVIRVATIDGEVPVSTAAGTDFRLAVTLHDLLRPQIREGAGLAPNTGLAERRHEISVSVKASPSEIDWPTWHLSVARSVADTWLRELQADQALPLPREQRQSELMMVAEPAIAERPDLAWPSSLAPAPDSGVERWHGPFQTPLVRGFAGVIVGTTIPVRGVPTPTIERLNERLAKGEWSLQGEAPSDWSHTPDRLVWTCERDDAYDKVVAERRSYGWELVVWELHPQALAVIDAWLAAAEQGSAVALTQLRRHVAAPLISAAQRERMQALIDVGTAGE